MSRKKGKYDNLTDTVFGILFTIFSFFVLFILGWFVWDVYIIGKDF